LLVIPFHRTSSQLTLSDVGGEFVRSDVRDGQPGVELILDTQVIDMATCSPVTTAMVEIWHTNATGVYGGIVANGNGVGTADPSNAFNTYCRGLQHTDSSGVAQFTTIFPGHYTGRTTHIHVLAHLNGAVTANGKYSGGTNAHVGQLFFDQSLISQVEAVSPYSGNTQSVTTNAADSIFLSESASSDPIVEYSLLGNTVADGIFAWVAFGINVSNSFTVAQAASLAASITAPITKGGSTAASASTSTPKTSASTAKVSSSSSTSSKTTSSTAASTSTVAKYGQCGGLTYTGSTVCVSGTTCTYSNAYYSQCL
jgi:protocatechuate 3,4-dioxygenase beta subunit